MMNEKNVDILIAGGGLGGIAAALGALESGYRVVLTEETDWIGGQLTSQAVPPDEHFAVEENGCTRRYRQLRDGIRNFYRDNYPLTSAAKEDKHFNPGSASVSRIAHEPKVALAVLRQMIAPWQASGALDVRLCRKPIAVDADGDFIRGVTFKNLKNGQSETFFATFFIDATELGELLPLGGVEYVSGAESKSDTGEAHAVDGAAQPDNVQAFTWCFPAAYDPSPGAEHVIERPKTYDFWRNYVPSLTPAWPGKLLSFTYSSPRNLHPTTGQMFPASAQDKSFTLWRYRRIFCADNFEFKQPAHDISIINWPQNDYMCGNIIDKPEEEIARHLEASKQLSLSLLYWLQTEAPLPDGRLGLPGLYLRPDVSGTEDGLAKAPYFRESRRIKALHTITETYLSRAGRTSLLADPLEESVGIGAYNMDLHPSTGGNNYIDHPASLFQIPLGALIPVRMRNLLPACKNIGTTHLSNGSYRLHPVEWNIGEVAGILSAFCISCNTEARAVYDNKTYLKNFQSLLVKHGIELAWPANL